ncbi:MAG: RluA family pseudouridine synthase [Deltaproteobacteria bacterium]|nr:RluA family pseudouridine synthase [Deltaproteobacteria bacterium]
MADEPPRRHWVVAPDAAGVRLDRFLTARGELGTRSQVHRLIGDGAVEVNGRVVKAGTMVRAGDRIAARLRAAVPVGVEPEAIPLDVLFEDEVLLAINKPPGLVVHPAPGHWQGTLVSALLHRWPTAASGLDPARLGIVHRLDKDTSGVLLIARTAEALADLGRQFRGRTVRKQYVALVWGAPRLPRGVIDKPIGRHPVQRKRMAVRGAGGRAARTRYEIVERFTGISLVRAFPETGRTHQIRVHLAALGCPIVADPLYARPRPGPPGGIARQALHAERIDFAHPSSGAPVSLAAPLPGDLNAALAALRARKA